MFEQHKSSHTPEYRIWHNMIQRCTNPNNPLWKWYGGRGIKVCERWLFSFSAFLKDVGKKPAPDLTFDRTDNNGNYEPNNWRWATWKEQQNNRRKEYIIMEEDRLCNILVFVQL